MMGLNNLSYLNALANVKPLTVEHPETINYNFQSERYYIN